MALLQSLEHPPSGLFWSTPLSSDSDFTAEDPLAFDYLAQQVGLWLFRGLTTRTSRAQNYAVVLYGLSLADKAIQHFGYPANDETRTRLFERWERFWSLATLEFRKGQLVRGDEDGMRGVRGAMRAWFPGNKPLPADFTLISRQNELGGLGAYLSSLRDYGLVFPGSLRVTPAAREIIDAFWSEKAERDWSRLYEEYALGALNFDVKTIPRSNGRLTLAGLGDRSRLSCLVRHNRGAQQLRLWNVLFIGARDNSTLPLANCLVAASKNRDEIDNPERLLEGMIAGRWRSLTSENRDKVLVALLFGRISRLLLRSFDRAYGHVNERGWVADLADVAEVSFPDSETEVLHRACNALLEAQDSRRFRSLQFHGRDFLALLRNLTSSNSITSLEHLLMFHQKVQRSRRGGGSWLRLEQTKIVMQVAGYGGYGSETGFPGFKFNVVRQLLADLGKLK